jgi:general L-amino acid transport system substrate-binding protein
MSGTHEIRDLVSQNTQFPAMLRNIAAFGRVCVGGLCIVMLVLVWTSGGASASILKTIKERGYLNCGIGGVAVGQNFRDQSGRWVGFYPDVCRAIAAAVLGSGDEVEFIPTEAQNWADALKTGAIDVLIDGRTWTLTRDAGLGLHFAGIYLYDGQGFLARRALNINRLAEAGTARICVAAGTTTEANLQDYKAAHKAAFELVVFQAWDESVAGIFKGRCDILTADRLLLVSARANRADRRDDYVLLPDVISREPLGPVVKAGDDAWFNVVKWVLFATIVAEERNITRANLETMKHSTDPEIRRLLGVEPGMGKILGLDENWAARVITAVGNYGDIFERNLGRQSAINLERGQNALWNQGGLIYAPPVR